MCIDADGVDVIDLCSPVTVTAPIIQITDRMDRMSVVRPANEIVAEASKQTSYQSRTLSLDSPRHSILPAFPASGDNERPDLLLANVPCKCKDSAIRVATMTTSCLCVFVCVRRSRVVVVIGHLLSDRERNRRRPHEYRPTFLLTDAPATDALVNTRIPSFFWPIYDELFGEITERLHVDVSILDYNYARLCKCIDVWARENTRRFNVPPHELVLEQQDYAVALEFYLQIDGTKHLRAQLSDYLCIMMIFSGLVLHENMFISRCSARADEQGSFLFE